ncbi:outer membrane protein, nutrient binding [Filimonas lacunae]|nr:outer membrane protein, nutrient binding [Filimonas lacunae]
MAGIVETTVGNYTYLNGSDRIYYSMVLQDLCENRGDNVTLQDWAPVGQYTDAFYFRNSTGLAAGSSADFYRGSYQLIISANLTLEGIQEFKTSTFASLTEADRNKVTYAEGENRFLRAFTYFNLVRIYGKPYYQANAQDLAVPLKTSTDITDIPARSSVKNLYAFIVSELKSAAELMKAPVTKTNSFASTASAWALLSRVYLYMGGSIDSPDAASNQLAITYADSVIAQTSGKYDLLQGTDYINMLGDDETGALGRSVFASNKEIIFAYDNTTTGGSPIGLLYHYYPSDGLGAIFVPSAELKSLYTSIDLRSTFFKVNTASGKVETTKWLCLNQGGTTLAPCIYFRLAEVYLNRSEAYAKLNNVSNAKADLKLIHQRAGLSGTEVDNLADAAVLDAILKERRMELAFEGHCSFDYFRNGLPMTRDAADYNGVALTIQPTDNNVVFAIPNQ